MNQDPDRPWSPMLRWILTIVAVLVSAAAFYALSLNNYLLYHSTIELLAAGVAVSIFTTGWNSRRIVTGNPLFLLAAAYGSVAVLDLLYALSYSGMMVFPDRDSHPAAQFWMASRLVESISLLAGSFLIQRRRNLPEIIVLAIYAVVTGALILLILSPGLFPEIYYEGRGLAAGKTAGAYVICGILGLSIFTYLRQRDKFNHRSLQLLTAAIAVTIASELSFILYTDADGFLNFPGHLLKLVSFVLIYKALVSGFLSQPYKALLKELTQSRSILQEKQERLRAAEEKHDNLVEFNADGIMVIDKEGIILFVNTAAANMLGRTENELIGEQFGYPLTPGEKTEIELLSGSQETTVAELKTRETEWDGKAARLASFRDVTDR
ncbi:MAG: MASE3 domain-containing protein, partial [Desulfosalsimonas sp.]